MTLRVDNSTNKTNKKPYTKPTLVKLDKNNLTENQKKMVIELEKQLARLKKEKHQK